MSAARSACWVDGRVRLPQEEARRRRFKTSSSRPVVRLAPAKVTWAVPSNRVFAEEMSDRPRLFTAVVVVT